MKIEIRPLPVTKWHGKTGKDDIAQPLVLECLMDNSGKYVTGLSDDETHEYSDKLGVSLSSSFRSDEPHPFYGTRQGKLILPYHTVILDTANPIEFVKYKFAKQSRYIAPSLKAWENGEATDATHVIYSEEEDMQVKASKVSIKAQAYKLSLDMSDTVKQRVIAVMTDKLRNFKSARGKDSNFLIVEIERLIDDNPKLFIEIATDTKDSLGAKAMVLEAIEQGVLTKEGSGIYYMSDLIGHGIEEAGSYFTNPVNHQIRQRVVDKLSK